MSTMLFVLGTAWAAAADPAASQPFQAVEVKPRDQALSDRSFVEFRSRLRKAIEKHDVQFVLDSIDPDIKCGFGGDDGKDAFIDVWELKSNPEESRLWGELGEVLRLGGVFMDVDGDKQFIAPYSNAEFPEDLEPFEFGLVTGAKVRVRIAPSAKAETIASVTHVAVRFVDDPEPVEETIGNETFAWRKVALADGRQGYIWGKYVRSPIDFRAGFSKKSGEWRMVFFVAGD